MPKPVCFFQFLEHFNSPLDQHPTTRYICLEQLRGLGESFHLCHLGTFPAELLSDGIEVGTGKPADKQTNKHLEVCTLDK